MSSSLSLYLTPFCFFCQRVLFVANQLGIELQHIDLYDQPEAGEDLLALRGRTTVPVLRMNDAQGGVRFLPESHDIIRALKSFSAQGGVPDTVPESWMQLPSAAS
ncbi:MAG: glutathione S-transferase domain-containing protein [Polyangiaceae bacterium]|nr:glutathione S-transferase domain-containing protein [Polyangiaceae bacterium]